MSPTEMIEKGSSRWCLLNLSSRPSRMATADAKTTIVSTPDPLRLDPDSLPISPLLDFFYVFFFDLGGYSNLFLLFLLISALLFLVYALSPLSPWEQIHDGLGISSKHRVMESGKHEDVCLLLSFSRRAPSDGLRNDSAGGGSQTPAGDAQDRHSLHRLLSHRGLRTLGASLRLQSVLRAATREPRPAAGAS